MRIFCLSLKVLLKCAFLSKLLLFGNLTPGFVTPLVKSLLRQRNYLYHRGQVAKADTLSLKIWKIINAVRSDRFSNVDVRDSKKLWQMIKSNTNYNSRCTIESLGVNIDEQINNINAFFTNHWSWFWFRYNKEHCGFAQCHPGVTGTRWHK